MRSRGSLVVLLAVLLADSASAAVLCVNKKGAIRRRETACKPKESVLDLSQYGAAGPPGPPGVIASAFAAYRYDTDSGYVPVHLPADSSLGDVIDLNGGGRHSGPLTVDAPARLVVTGSAYLSNGDIFQRSFQCRIQLRPQGGSAQNITFTTYDSIAVYDVITWSLATTIDIDPGTYNLALQCSTGLSNNGGQAFDADLTAIAYRR